MPSIFLQLYSCFKSKSSVKLVVERSDKKSLKTGFLFDDPVVSW